MPSPQRYGRPTIGVLAGWQFYWTATPLSYLDPIFRGIHAAARDHGCNLLLSCGMGSSATTTDAYRPAWPAPTPDVDFVPVGPWNTDGLIVVNPLLSETRSRYVQDLRANGHPILFIGAGEHGPTICADNTNGIHEAMHHLVEHGHRRIAFIAGTPEDMDGDTGDRLRAYQSAAEAYALTADPRLVAYGRHVFDGGYRAMRQMLDGGLDFSAVLASNDESALGVIQALRDAGRNIPQDVAVIGFDDRPEAVVHAPALSTVRVPLFKLGYRALELTLQCLAGDIGPDERFTVPTRLVPRQTCGCGHGAIATAVPDLTRSRTATTDRAERQSQLVQAMAESILAESQLLGPAEAHGLCRELVAEFVAGLAADRPLEFLTTLEDTLLRIETAEDDAHVWQAAISIMRQGLADLLPRPEAYPPAHDLLDRARILISESMRRQHHRYARDQRWIMDRVGLLTARLQSTLDESEVLAVLASHLPEMGVQRVAIAQFEAAGDDPVARSVLRTIPASTPELIRFPSREFPPEAYLPPDQPFSQTLLPLAGQRGPSGFVAFDATHIELYGAIVQQLAAALKTAQLYREATEGRRLAEEANNLKSRFLSTVSHELRTPLNLIVGLSQILLQESEEGDSPLADPHQKDVERIQASAQHLGALIGDVLDLASSDAGQLRLANEYIDLTQTLQAVAEIGNQLALDKGLVWRASLPEPGPWVWGDRTRLRQVALNLVSNAVKFTAHGEVSLTLAVEADRAVVSVGDTGLGIPPGEQQSIFDEFRRSERSAARGYGGLGLGLAICKRLIELHGGTVGVRSTGEEGRGSTFFFTLPFVAPSPVPAQPPAPPAAEQRVVLITQQIGDDRLREHLRRRQFDVQTVTLDGLSDWLAQPAFAPPSAIVLDVNIMPQRGWEALKALKGNPATQNVPVLFYALTQANGAVLELDYLTKPVGMAELAQALDEHWLSAGASAARRTILIVDDDPGTVEMHTRMVQVYSAECRVLQARDGRRALDVLQRERPDLVLLDLMMPEVDGFQVLAAMRDQPATRDVPVIVLTGQSLTEADMERLNRGVATVLSKGLFSIEETLAHVDAALARKRKLSSEAKRLVRRAMAYLHEHFAEPVSREDLARHVGMNDDYLTSCFRKELGMTPITYLKRYRIRQARALLAETGKSVTEIALAVGFSDSGYFSRVFRREVGVSPEAYRRTAKP